MPRDKTLHIGDGEAGTEQKNIFGAFVTEIKQPPLEPPPEEAAVLSASAVPETAKEPDTVTVSSSHEQQQQRKPVVKIKVKRSTASSRGDEGTDNQTVEKSQGCGINEPDHAASSSVSVDAPQRNIAETVSMINNQNNVEEVNSCHDLGSRVTASIGSAKLAGEDLGKELQCTADSSKISYHDPSSQGILEESLLNLASDAVAYSDFPTASAVGNLDNSSVAGADSPRHGKEREREREKKKEKDKKRRRDDPEYLERKRLKKEKKRREKEMTKLLSEENKVYAVEPPSKTPEEDRAKGPEVKSVTVQQMRTNEAGNSNAVVTRVDSRPEGSEPASAAPKIRIKIKNRLLNKS